MSAMPSASPLKLPRMGLVGNRSRLPMISRLGLNEAPMTQMTG